MSGKVSKNRNKTTVASLQKSNLLMKTMNKELALNLQKLKEDLSRTNAQNSSLKAELYDMITERNSLMEKNVKLIELLKSIHTDSLSIGKKIEDILSPRELEKERLTTKQSAMICPMVSGHVIHNPKVQLRRLNLRGTDAINLSPIVEEQFLEDLVPRRLGHRLRLSQNISSIGNRGVNENSFYSVGIDAENEGEGALMYSGLNDQGSNVSGMPSSLPMETNSVLSEEASETGSGNDVVEPEPIPSTSRSSINGNRATESRRNSISESGRNSGRNTLLTINVMSPKNEHQSSSIPVSPSVLVNVFPRKRKYTPKRSSSNEFTVSGMNSTNNEDHDYSKIIDYKEPIILLERHPVMPERIPSTSTASSNQGTNHLGGKPNIYQQSDETNVERKTRSSTQGSVLVKLENDDSSEHSSGKDARAKRRSSRIKKTVKYCEK